MENNLNLHQKRPHDGPHDGPDEVHGHGLIETDEALGSVFVRLAYVCTRTVSAAVPIKLSMFYKGQSIRDARQIFEKIRDNYV